MGKPPSLAILMGCTSPVHSRLLQGMLSDRTAVLAETGDSWFNCQKLKLPTGCG